MTMTDIISSIDAEIARLEQARQLMVGFALLEMVRPNRNPAPKKAAKKKRVMSAEARKRIGDAQRKRWAAQKKAAK